MTQKLLRAYDQEAYLYAAFTEKVGGLVIEILKENNINVHSVTYRLKDRESLAKKISRPDSHYTSLHDVTDIAGIRITTYFEDDVDKIAQLIEQEFEIDRDNSVDKRTLLDPDRFGYLSLHYVVRLSPERCRLTEYKRFPQLKAEIQTRSILQHAWAEIEHDLGYKSRQEVPQTIRRRFSRLAGLLELADQEFISIRNELSTYEKNVPLRIEETPQLVTVDKASLSAFLSSSDLVNELDSKIAAFCNARITLYKPAISIDLQMLQHFGISTIGEIEEKLEENSNLLIRFAQNWLTGEKHKTLPAGISIFYLGYVLIARAGDPKQINEYLDKIHVGEANRERLIQNILKTYDSIQEGNPSNS